MERKRKQDVECSSRTLRRRNKASIDRDMSTLSNTKRAQQVENDLPNEYDVLNDTIDANGVEQFCPAELQAIELDHFFDMSVDVTDPFCNEISLENVDNHKTFSDSDKLGNSSDTNVAVSYENNAKHFDTENIEQQDESIDVDALLDDSDAHLFSDSDEDSDIETEDKPSLKDELAKWAQNCRVPLVTLGALLVILRLYFPYLPKDPRVILKTPRQSNIKEFQSGGEYLYLGLKAGLTNVLQHFQDTLLNH